ncbi:MAG: putative porin [Thermodesulfobacteriota bacterium]
MPKKLSAVLLSFALFGVWAVVPLSAHANVKISDFIEEVSLKGDLRVRYDYQDNDEQDNDPKDRLRMRFRAGMQWMNPAENWKIAAGLATGGAGAGSTNATFSDDEVFETGDIRLDYAYAQHSLENFTLIAGQHKNIFYSTMALWDSDVRPAGFAARYDMAPFFVHAGYFQVRYVNQDIAEMNAVQAGIDTGKVVVAAGLYNTHDTAEFLNDQGRADDVPALDPDYEYRIADFYTEGAFEMAGIEISPFGQVFYNFGAEGGPGEGALAGSLDPENENLGWLVGVDGKLDRYSLGVQYTEIGADAAVQDIKDSDFGSGLDSTDVKGFKIGLGYMVTPHMQCKTTAYYYEPLERDIDRDITRYQVDLKYKF